VIADDSGPNSVVNEYEHWDLRAPEVLVASSAYDLQPDLLGHAVDARAAIERGAAAHACLHATDGDLGLLAGYADAIELAAAGLLEPGPQLDAFAHAETWFHTTLDGSRRTRPGHAQRAAARRAGRPAPPPGARPRPRLGPGAPADPRRDLQSRTGPAEDAVDAYARALRRLLGARG